MSNQVNDTLLERAYELLENLTSHPSGYDKALATALENRDLERVHELVALLEAELSREHFHNYDLTVW